MKKVFLSLALCAVAFAASAQLKSIDGRIDYIWDTGFGVGATIGITDQIEVAPSFALYFPGGDNSLWTAGADAHYLLPEFVEKLDLYPIAGIGFYHTSYEEAYVANDYEIKYRDKSDNTVFINAGAGARYHFHEQWAAFAEVKYQLVDGWNHEFFTAGISFKF